MAIHERTAPQTGQEDSWYTVKCAWYIGSLCEMPGGDGVSIWYVTLRRTGAWAGRWQEQK